MYKNDERPLSGAAFFVSLVCVKQKNDLVREENRNSLPGLLYNQSKKTLN